MAQTEYGHRGLGVGIHAQRAEASHVLESLVSHGQADHGIHQIGIGVNAAQYTQQQGGAMAPSQA